MIRFWLMFLAVVCACPETRGQTQGLQFASHEVVQEKRTSLNLTPADPICFNNTTDLSFDLIFRPNLETYFGYVLRIVTTGNQNIDLVYNQKLLQFNFVIGEEFSFPFSIDSVQLFGSWNNVNIRFDESGKLISLFWNGKELCKKTTGFKSPFCARIVFGVNDNPGFQITDVPPMSVRDIRIIENGKPKHLYSLGEISGNTATDAVTHQSAPVKNAVWIRPRHQQWREILSISTTSSPSVAFSQKDEFLFVIGLDSLYSLSLKNNALSGTRLSRNRGFMPPGNQSIVSRLDERLYNFYTDEKIVGAYDSLSKSWTRNFPTVPLTIYWHSNKFISPFDSCLYIVAGYGQLQYKKSIQRFHFNTGSWDTVHATGDFFMPRYLAALGTNRTGDTAYILGGYGSNTGDQTINPKSNYDLLSYSVAGKEFKLLTHLKEPEIPFGLANSMIIEPGTDRFYALIYPKDRFDAGLQLIQGSLHDGDYRKMADSIPYSFYDVESYADLYYDSTAKKLIAVTMKMQKNNLTTVKAYTLDFPPNSVEQGTVQASEKSNSLWIIISTGILVIGGLAISYIIRNRKGPGRNSTSASEPASAIPTQTLPATEIFEETDAPQVPVKSAVFLFGAFEAIDKDGQDLTAAFTPLLREIFLLILIDTYRDGRGISPDKLFETIWGDKSQKDARNNYSVNSVKLKAILEKLGSCHISRDTGKLRFEHEDSSVSVDFQRFMELTGSKKSMTRTQAAELISILQRGPFLYRQNFHWSDDLKSEVSGMVIDALVGYLDKADQQTEAEFMIKIANVIFLSDHLNEEALKYKCRSLVLLGRHGLAKDAYAKFAKEYRENYGQEFEKSFTQITS